MSSNNSGGLALGLVLIAGLFLWVLVVVAFYMLIGMAIVFGFIAFSWTFVCLIAWNRPFHLGPVYLYPGDARAFVIRGLFGAVMVPAFLYFLDVFMDVVVPWDYLAWFAFGGYTLLSAGIGYLMDEGEPLPHVYYDVVPGRMPDALPAPAPEPVLYLPPSPARKFEYASWDDELKGVKPAPKTCKGCGNRALINPDAPRVLI